MKLPLAILITIGIIAFTYFSGLITAIKLGILDEEDDLFYKIIPPFLIGIAIDLLIFLIIGLFAVIYENI